VEGLVWAFGRLNDKETYWHPLTWVSHMVDCQLFGLRPAGHHLVNVLLHALNAVLVFLLFRQITGHSGNAPHWPACSPPPLAVDTVAWVSERKNLLSALFWMLTLLAYVRYAQQSKPRV